MIDALADVGRIPALGVVVVAKREEFTRCHVPASRYARSPLEADTARTLPHHEDRCVAVQNLDQTLWVERRKVSPQPAPNLFISCISGIKLY